MCADPGVTGDSQRDHCVNVLTFQSKHYENTQTLVFHLKVELQFRVQSAHFNWERLRGLLPPKRRHYLTFVYQNTTQINKSSYRLEANIFNYSKPVYVMQSIEECTVISHCVLFPVPTLFSIYKQEKRQ